MTTTTERSAVLPTYYRERLGASNDAQGPSLWACTLTAARVPHRLAHQLACCVRAAHIGDAVGHLMHHGLDRALVNLRAACAVGEDRRGRVLQARKLQAHRRRHIAVGVGRE